MVPDASGQRDQSGSGVRSVHSSPNGLENTGVGRPSANWVFPQDTTSAVSCSAFFKSVSNIQGEKTSSESRNSRNVPEAAARPAFRAAPALEWGWRITRKRGSFAARVSRMEGDESVDPSSTQMHSQSVNVWAQTESRQSSRYLPALKTGITTDSLVLIAKGFPRKDLTPTRVQTLSQANSRVGDKCTSSQQKPRRRKSPQGGEDVRRTAQTTGKTEIIQRAQSNGTSDPGFVFRRECRPFRNGFSENRFEETELLFSG